MHAQPLGRDNKNKFAKIIHVLEFQEWIENFNE